jgi:hypothetical protein
MTNRTKKCLSISFFSSIGIITLLVIIKKVGYEKYRTYLDPMPWSEIIEGFHFIFLIWLSTFVILFFWMFKYYRQPTYCIYCKKVISNSETNIGSCPTCGKKTESLDGVFERHPELLNK